MKIEQAQDRKCNYGDVVIATGNVRSSRPSTQWLQGIDKDVQRKKTKRV